jgi:CrcB protein
MLNILIIGCGGFLGAISRYFVSELVYTFIGAGLPYGTLAINLVGSFLLGIVAQLGLSGDILPDSVNSFVGIGFLGAFTTFSTFSVQTLELLESGSLLKALLNISLNIFLCLIGAWGGFTLGRILT